MTDPTGKQPCCRLNVRRILVYEKSIQQERAGTKWEGGASYPTQEYPAGGNQLMIDDPIRQQTIVIGSNAGC